MDILDHFDEPIDKKHSPYGKVAIICILLSIIEIIPIRIINNGSFQMLLQYAFLIQFLVAFGATVIGIFKTKYNRKFVFISLVIFVVWILSIIGFSIFQKFAYIK